MIRKCSFRPQFLVAILLVLAQVTFALTASQAMEKSKAWFKSGKAWSLDFKLQVFYADSPDIASQMGSLKVAEGDKFVLISPASSSIATVSTCGNTMWSRSRS